MWHYAKPKLPAGIALLAVLIFLQILFLLTGWSIQAILMTTKSQQYFFRRQYIFSLAENSLQKMESSVLLTCLVPVLSTNELRMQPVTWWKKLSNCQGEIEKFPYYSVIEDLGDDPCAMVEKTSEIAHYYRVSLLFQGSAVPLFLQSTIVVPEERKQMCVDFPHVVKRGRQSWRD